MYFTQKLNANNDLQILTLEKNFFANLLKHVNIVLFKILSFGEAKKIKIMTAPAFHDILWLMIYFMDRECY